MKELLVNHGVLFNNNQNIKGKQILKVIKYTHIKFTDFIENFSDKKIYKDGNIYEFLDSLEGNLFKICGLQYGDEKWHYIEINDEYVTMVIDCIVVGFVINLNNVSNNENTYKDQNNLLIENKIKTYIMVDTTNNLYKIGKSVNPKYREKTLQSEKPTIELYLICDYDVEKILHIKYKDKRIRGEWFSLSQNDLIDIVLEHDFEKIH